jgi:hypothetical protein
MGPLPPNLELARRWVSVAGDPTEVDEVENPDGTTGPGLTVEHGNVRLRLLPRGDLILVLIAFGIPADAREKLAGLEPESRRKLLLGLRIELLSCHRAAFYYTPADATDVSQLEQFLVLELVHVSEEDPSSRNRLMDALQEVTAVGLRGTHVLGIASLAPPPTRGGVPPRAPPPPGLYG